MKKRIKKLIINISLILAIGLGYAGICMYTGFGIPCMFRVVTGLKCSGCGITHMCLAMLRLDFRDAFHNNAFLFCLFPLFAIYAIILMARYVKNGKVKINKKENMMCYVLIALLIIWGILRNLYGI